MNLIKLSVGSESIESLRDWQAAGRAQGPDGRPRHVTRMWPKRADEVLSGGSMYWVIKGSILCRQPIVRFDACDIGDGVNRCAIVLEPGLIPVAPTLKRPFQGWRYLKPEDAPIDLPTSRQREEALPPELASALTEIGVI